MVFMPPPANVIPMRIRALPLLGLAVLLLPLPAAHAETPETGQDRYVTSPRELVCVAAGPPPRAGVLMQCGSNPQELIVSISVFVSPGGVKVCLAGLPSNVQPPEQLPEVQKPSCVYLRA